MKVTREEIRSVLGQHYPEASPHRTYVSSGFQVFGDLDADPMVCHYSSPDDGLKDDVKAVLIKERIRAYSILLGLSGFKTQPSSYGIVGKPETYHTILTVTHKDLEPKP